MNKRSHFRKVIQKKLQDSGQFQIDIYNGRRDPKTIRKLPAIFIINLDESVERFCDAPVIFRKTYHFGIEVLVSHPHTIDEQLDQITDQIEKCLLSDDGSFLGEELYWFHLESTDFNWSSRGDEILGHARMIFKVMYDTTPGEQKELNDLRELELNYEL